LLEAYIDRPRPYISAAKITRLILIKFGAQQLSLEPNDSHVTKNENFQNSRWRTVAIFENRV